MSSKKSKREVLEERILSMQGVSEDFTFLEVEEALLNLSDYERELLHLKYFEDVKIKDIAVMWNTPEGTIKTRLHKALRALGQDLKRKGRLNVFEEEKKKLEQRKKSIDKIEVPMDKLHSAVRSGFEKAKKERALKRTKIIKRSSWSIVIAAILLISFVTSISVSPVFANKIASIPGMDRIVALIQQDRGLNCRS